MKNESADRLWEIVQGNLAEWGLGEACIKLVKIASFFSPDGFPKHILRHLWNDLVYPGLEDWGDQGEIFGQAVDLAKKYNLFQSVDPIRIHRLDRAAILQTAKAEAGLEEAVGKSLASYVGMSPEDWLLLADNIGALRYIPEDFLCTRCGIQELHMPSPAQWLSQSPLQQSMLGYRQRVLSFFGLADERDLISLQVRLLFQNNAFQSMCQWQKLDANDWTVLLSAYPQFKGHCPWNIPSRRSALGYLV